jgi:hypothetical protein
MGRTMTTPTVTEHAKPLEPAGFDPFIVGLERPAPPRPPRR